ncbi:hypothetical protein [Rhizobium ecuadorense]|uniref:hypothetical protein n=1 Tax=Rhizobium ecuadorense TaxID=1671795 RepID=UPI001FCD52C4|nr:hypothetical protein [Rhizobium ecuadorense]
MDRLGHDAASAFSITTKIVRDGRCFNPILAHLVLFLFLIFSLAGVSFTHFGARGGHDDLTGMDQISFDFDHGQNRRGRADENRNGGHRAKPSAFPQRRD